MFKDTTFYHSHIRKSIIAFGTIFNNINIERKNSSGAVAQTIRVPLAYSTKQKFITRINRVPDSTTRGEVALTLPRIGFEIDGIRYDPTRKTTAIQKNKAVGLNDDVNTVRTVFNSTPYNMNLSLYIFAKNQEDGLQILEQIIPYFNPDFNVTVNDLPELNIKRDIKITLDNVSYEDQYEGDFASRLSIIWTLNFTMTLNFYSNVNNVGVIKKAIADIFNDPEMALNRTLTSNRERLTVSVNPTSATPSDDYTFLEEFDAEFE